MSNEHASWYHFGATIFLRIKVIEPGISCPPAFLRKLHVYGLQADLLQACCLRGTGRERKNKKCIKRLK